MIDMVCLHQNSNNRHEEKDKVQEIRASPATVQDSNTLDASRTYHGGLPNVDLSREDLKISGVTQ